MKRYLAFPIMLPYPVDTTDHEIMSPGGGRGRKSVGATDGRVTV